MLRRMDALESGSADWLSRKTPKPRSSGELERQPVPSAPPAPEATAPEEESE